MNDFIINNSLNIIVTLFFSLIQFRYFWMTRSLRKLYSSFFVKKQDYTLLSVLCDDTTSYKQLQEVGMNGSDLNELIKQINNYVQKSKGTTDFSVIQNKVERLLRIRYEQSLDYISFPVQFGLMGTFLGVFLGISMFLWNFNGAGTIGDESIQALMSGILVSMFTSLFGLILTITSNAKQADAKLKIEREKNDFFDFIQTELMPSLNVSLVAAIGKLHQTVNQFEPAFNEVINRFQSTFDNCTAAFGTNFKQNVIAVSDAVRAMGANMDKINQNIQLQKELISVLKSDKVAVVMNQFVKVSDRFSGVMLSLDKFEEARRMMLAAAQESINIQNAYVESLHIPLEVAVRINKILDRITTFEEKVNTLGIQIADRDILGNDLINKLQEQVAAIAKKQHIVDDYVEKTDEQLKDSFANQIAVIKGLTTTYSNAIDAHIQNYESLMQNLAVEVQNRHKEFMMAMDERLSIEDIRMEFTNLKKLQDIDMKLNKLDGIIGKLDEMNKQKSENSTYATQSSNYTNPSPYTSSQSAHYYKPSAKPVSNNAKSLSNQDTASTQKLTDDVELEEGNRARKSLIKKILRWK